MIGALQRAADDQSALMWKQEVGWRAGNAELKANEQKLLI